MQDIDHPYYQIFQSGQNICEQIIQDVLTDAGQILYQNHVLKTKTASYISNIMNQQLFLIYKQQNLINQCPKPCFDAYQDQKIIKTKIDSWAFQSLKKKQFNQQQIEQQQRGLYNKVSRMISPKRNNEEKNNTILIKQNLQQQVPDFLQLKDSTDSDAELDDEKKTNLMLVNKRLRNERLAREIKKEEDLQKHHEQIEKEKQIQEQKNKIKQNAKKQSKITFDFNGQPIYLKKVEENKNPNDIALISYQEQKTLKQQKPYQNLNVQLQNTQEIKVVFLFQENLIMNDLEQKYLQAQLQPKKEQKVLPNAANEVFELQMGVQIIKEDGIVIKGPLLNQNNRPKKKDYQKQIQQEITETSEDYSMTSILKLAKKQKDQDHQRDITENKEQDSSIDNDEKNDKFQTLQKTLFDSKKIKIIKDLEYVKMINSLQNRPVTAHIQPLVPKEEPQELVRRETDRIHSYRPDIFNPQAKNSAKTMKNTQKVETFNNQQIFNNENWGTSVGISNENVASKKVLPAISSSRVKSAKLLSNTTSMKRTLY